MIRFKSKVVAILGGAAMVASGALFASPAQAAMSCSSVPGQTIGADVKVGPVVQRVPAISNIQLCVGTGTPPLASVTFSGGTCTSNCLTVTVGSDVDLEGATVSYKEDGVLRTQALNPAPVEVTDPSCVISVGMPDAPNPNCFIAIGPDDPTGVITPIMNTVNSTITTVLNTADTAVDITCDLIPDRYDYPYSYDFCTDPIGWTSSTTNYYYNYSCNRIPDMYDRWGQRNDFCTNPVGWTNAVIDTATTNPIVCDSLSPMYDPNYGYYVYFCDDPVRWTTLYLQSWCNNLCDAETLDRLIVTLQRRINEAIQIQADTVSIQAS